MQWLSQRRISALLQGVGRGPCIYALPRDVDVTDCFDKPVKTCQNILWFCKHSQKGPNRTAKSLFFSLNYKPLPIQTGFEQLSSSIRWRVMASSKRGVLHPRLGFVGAEIFTKFCFFVHNFSYRYARKSFKGSKDADFGLVPKKILSQNNGSMDWGPGKGKSGQKKPKHPHLQRSPQRTPNRKRKAFFSILSRRLAESVDGLDNSLTKSPGELSKSASKYMGVRGR